MTLRRSQRTPLPGCEGDLVPPQGVAQLADEPESRGSLGAGEAWPHGVGAGGEALEVHAR